MHIGWLPEHEVVLLGIGHTNAHVLRMWRMQAPANARLTCISNSPIATYSGMLPGVLAGQYPREQMEIDLVRLCSAIGARLIVEDVVAIDRDKRLVLFKDRPEIPYDLLSVGIGSVPVAPEKGFDESVVTIKPMQTFLQRLEHRFSQLNIPDNRPVRIAIVGGGAGGIEVAFCLPAATGFRFPTSIGRPVANSKLQIILVNSDNGIVGGASEKTRKLVQRELERRNIECIFGARAMGVTSGTIVIEDGRNVAADIVIWATGATAPALLKQLGLPYDERGFLRTKSTLQSVADDRIFAVGDSGTIEGSDHPKAGVYAVRQGPVLWENIHRFLEGKPLRQYRPQRKFLKLLNTGDGRSILEYGPVSQHAAWCWKLKDSIDGRFMDKYQNYEPAMMEQREMNEPAERKTKMRCLGCGSKVGGTTLSRVLARLNVPSHPQVALGLDRPDDAAVIQANGLTSITVDYFAAPLDDPYIVGRIAALNAASDSFAMGSVPVAALATVALPYGGAKPQEQILYELMRGGLMELSNMGATLAGGHTVEGPQLAIGFTMIASQPDQLIRTKEGLQPGDRLALTKPLGSGVLLAAHMQAKCRASWYQSLIEAMLTSNQRAAQIAMAHGVIAMTDVTGFGLAGHLLEMLKASGVSAEIDLNQVPLLPGAEQLIGDKFESTLAPHNRDAEQSMDAAAALVQLPVYAALFDPQTAGGLLLGVPSQHAAALDANWPGPYPLAWIGRVLGPGEARIVVR